MKIELADSWSNMLKWWSLRISGVAGIMSAAGTAIAATGAVVPWFGILPRWEVLALVSIVFWSIFISRIIKQSHKDKTDASA